jgi:hypothetical protein
MRRLGLIFVLAILLAGATVHAQKGVTPIQKDSEYDVCVQDDQNGYYLLFNSKSGNYVFERCSDGVEFQGTGQISAKDCQTTLEHVGFNRYVLAIADSCSGEAKGLVRVFKGLRTLPYIPPMIETLTDSSMKDDTWDCTDEKTGPKP